MKETVFKKRLGDVEQSIERVDPANNGFTGTAIAEHLNSKYNGPPRPKSATTRKLNSRGLWATSMAVSNILRLAHYPYVSRKVGKTCFHLGTDTTEMQKEIDQRSDLWKNKRRIDDYIEPFIRYWTDDAYGLEDVATELDVAIATILKKFRRLEESSAYGHYPVQYRERTGHKRKVTRRKKKNEA